MSQSTKVTKSDKALSFMGVRRTFSRGGTSTFCLLFSNCWRSVFPPRKFCTEQIFVLVSMIILRLCNWIFQWITNFVNYIINIQSYQNTNKITFHNIASCSRAFPCFAMLQVRENEISLRNSSGGPEYLRPLEGTLLTMHCKWTFTKRFILSTLQRKCPMLR